MKRVQNKPFSSTSRIIHQFFDTETLSQKKRLVVNTTIRLTYYFFVINKILIRLKRYLTLEFFCLLFKY